MGNILAKLDSSAILRDLLKARNFAATDSLEVLVLVVMTVICCTDDCV
jgi:hypothetical protein